ncbi:MAG: hypothetical protein KF726_14645 [Anaerolineae bacterium]|nr:hypothetical protein [Anaerolineae bacterium]
MARSSTTWKTGQSGNPGGRPASPLKALKARPVGIALLTLISELTSVSELREDSEHEAQTETSETPARAERIANTLLEAMETGVVELRGGKQMDMSVKEWLQLTRWTLKHMEGNLRAIRPDQEIIEPSPVHPDPEPSDQDQDDATMEAEEPPYYHYENVPLNTYVDPLTQEYRDWFKEEWERAQAEGRDDVPPYQGGEYNREMWHRWGEARKAKRAAEQAAAQAALMSTAIANQNTQGQQTQSAPTVPDSSEVIEQSPPIPTAGAILATPGIRILRRGGGAAAEMETHTERLRDFFTASQRLQT